MTVQDSGCCPPFDPVPWDGRIVEWSGKRFVKDHVRTFFHIPLNFGTVMRRLDSQVHAAGAAVPDWLCLSDHTSRWNMDVYLAVDREVPGAENVILGGRFFTKVYEGPFGDTGTWCRDFGDRAQKDGHVIKKWYMWYTTCPACAEKYGKNYVVIVGEV